MSLSKEEKRVFRSILFKHQDGIAITAIVTILSRHKVFNFLLKEKKVSLQKIIDAFPQFHAGYLNIALRSLASQGILRYSIREGNIQIETTSKFDDFLFFVPHYVTFNELYQEYYTLFKNTFEFPLNVSPDYYKLSAILNNLRQSNVQNVYFQEEVSIHLEGVLLAPLLVYLNYHADIKNKEVRVFLENERLFHFLSELGVFENGNLTAKGTFLIDKSYAYGVTVSYMPIMSHMETYLTGDFLPFFKQDHLGIEQHVFRGVNVWGSGGSHATYFKKFDAVLIDIFNKPLLEQPKGIIDVGCGNGALLEHIFDLIWNQTQRRDDLHNNTLILVGADYNKEALLSTKRNLERANVWAEVVWGDIGNPAEIDAKLQTLYNVRLDELLNVRSFLDHNRPFNAPIKERNFQSLSTGAFAHRGKQLNNSLVEQSLVEHFEKWKPYIKHHGLLLIELHTVASSIVSVNLGKTPCTAYDVTHGFSDQYIVELEVYLNAIQSAGISVDPLHSYKFPDSNLCTISINLIR